MQIREGNWFEGKTAFACSRTIIGKHKKNLFSSPDTKRGGGGWVGKGQNIKKKILFFNLK